MVRKNCIHYDVCRSKVEIDENKLKFKNMNRCSCDNFKDKLNYVEIPCKVGDTVYSIKHNHINKCNVIWIKIESKTSISIRLVTKDYTFYDIKLSDFNKTAFLTKESARRAMNKGEK